MDEIAITGIRALGRHGAYAGEKDRPQAFDVAVKMHVDLSASYAYTDSAHQIALTTDAGATHVDTRNAAGHTIFGCDWRV